jgi:hypothetical protein
VFEKAAAEGAKAVVIAAAIEAEIATMPAEDRANFLRDLGLEETGLSQIIRAGYELLDLITSSLPAPRNLGRGPWKKDRKRRRPRGSSTPISNAVYPGRDDRL